VSLNYLTGFFSLGSIYIELNLGESISTSDKSFGTLALVEKKKKVVALYSGGDARPAQRRRRRAAYYEGRAEYMPRRTQYSERRVTFREVDIESGRRYYALPHNRRRCAVRYESESVRLAISRHAYAASRFAARVHGEAGKMFWRLLRAGYVLSARCHSLREGGG